MEYDARLIFFDNLFHEVQLHLEIGDIFQISEVSLIRDGEIFEHPQWCDEITYAVSGKAKIYSDNKCTQVVGGQIHFIRKGIRHRIVAESEENFRFVCIGYAPNLDHYAVHAFMDSIDRQRYFTMDDNGTVKCLSECIIQEFYNWDEQSGYMVNQYLSQIFITMQRILCHKMPKYHDDSGKKTSYNVMYRILRYIDNEYLQITSVKQISEALSYSEYYLSHIFKEKMGITMKDYLNRKKISYAIKLLEQRQLSVEQISEYLKFTSPRAFRRVFKQQTGCVPSDYRAEKHRNFCP